MSRLPIRFPPFSVFAPSPRDRTITSFLFSFNYRCQGVTAPPPPPRLFPFLNLPPLFLYLFQLSAPREFVIAFNFSSPVQTHFFPRKNDSMLDSTRLLASANYSVNNATFLDRSERNKRKYKLPRKLAEHDNWCIPRVVLHIDDSPFTKLRGRIRRGGWFPWFEEGFEL